MRQLGVIRDKQAFSAAEVVREEYFFCGRSPGMFLFIPCLSRMTSEISHGSLLTARFRTRLLNDAQPGLDLSILHRNKKIINSFEKCENFAERCHVFEFKCTHSYFSCILL